MSTTIRTPEQFLTWLNGLVLAKAPNFISDAAKIEHTLVWREALKNVSEAEYTILRGHLISTLKFYPSPAIVLEALAGCVKIPFSEKVAAGTNPNFRPKWQGKDLMPTAYVLATPAQKAAIEKNLGHTSSLPKVYDKSTGDIMSSDKKIGNLTEDLYENRHNIKPKRK